jgi:zinc transport system substrate-binding protein
MKKFFTILLSALLLTAALSQCGSAADVKEAKKLSVVTTIFPQYDFARAVAGGNADITMLLRPGAESHSYDPTPQDILKIKNCDVFIYGGGESDEWVKGVLESLDTSKMRIISLMDCVEAVEEEIVEGMQDEEEGHGHDEAFTREDVRDRALTDWLGDWQSVYTYLLDGSLNPVMEHKAESGEKTAKEYYEEYRAHYVTDVERVVITADSMTFYRNGVPATARYAYGGTGITVIEEDGHLWVRYKFEAIGNPPAGAPKYIMFSDHLHAPAKTEHFHIYASDNSFDELMADTDPVNYPTYYAMDLTKDELVAEMIGHEHEEEAEYDEHVWTSPRNVKIIAQKISDAMSEADPANAAVYKDNTAAYQKELDKLDAAFSDVMKGASRKILVFGDRFPFRYFADAYGLKYFAAFPGCSTETEASAATVAFLIDKVRAEKIPVVFHIELSDEKIADTICESTGAKKLLLHASHNISRNDFQRGATYIEIMTANVGALREALK